VQAITEAGSVLVRGFQEISREWMELAQQRLLKNTEALSKLAQCRNVQDLAAVQTELVRENLHSVIDNTRRIAERSVKVATDAAHTISAEASNAAERFARAA
jgi:phasin family protein